MNIAYVLPEFVTERSYGGLAVYYDNVARLFADKGHRIIVIVLSDKEEKIDYYPNITVYRIRENLEGVNPNVPGSFMRQKSRQVNSFLMNLIDAGERIDMVQYPNFMALGLDRLGLPTVVRVSSYRPQLRYADREFFDVNKVYASEKVPDFLEDISVIKSDYVYGPSVNTAELVKKATRKDVDIIESTFYPGEFMNASIEACEDYGRYILTFGSLKILKGAKVIGDSVKEVLKRCPDIKWLFVGKEWNWTTSSGDEISPSRYILEKAGEYADRCVILGEMSKQELAPYVKGCEFVVMPSRVDNLPNTCIEAMAMRKVVIGTHGASFDQLIENGESGYLVERENPQDLIDAIVKVSELSNEETTRIGDNAKKRIDQMAPETICNRLEKVYRKTVEEYKEKDVRLMPAYKELVKKHNAILKETGIDGVEEYYL